MIVSLTRDDLRDEFAMADQAFALSPISARATRPSEEDYDAISEAFMETSRGRWFLGEYAKRNRNADTRMVLDAVARIEQTIAAQKQPAAETDSELAEALAAIRGALDEARAAASVAIDGLALEENLAPVRKGARVIREIAWRWREIGADGRICDLMDSQVSAIEGACGQISSTGARGALSTAFDLIEQRIAQFGDGDRASSQPAAEVSPPPAPSAEMLAAVAEAVAAATDDAEAAMSAAAMPAEAVVAPVETIAASVEAAAPAEAADITAEAVEVAVEIAEVTAEAAEAAAEVAEITADAAEAHDDALLDLIAFEMAEPDPSDIDDAPDADPDEIRVAELPPPEPVMVAPEAEPTAAAAQPFAIPPSLQPSPEPPESSPELSSEPAPEPSPELSLGSSLIASGIVRRPHAATSDPLAPIRRMSQVEKIALFS